MEPFFSGMAIGLAILIPLVIAMFAIRVLCLIGAFVYGFIAAATSAASRQRRGRVPDSRAASQPQP
jgi:hypothetical protein